jgi:hypothetical protein
MAGAVATVAQANRGELRFSVTDQSGAGLKARVELDSRANQFHQSLETDHAGKLVVSMVPFGAYEVTVQQQGFAPYQATIDVKSTVPLENRIRLSLAAVESEVKVSSEKTLVDFDSASAVTQIGAAQIADRASSLPGRTVQDLVVSQPGWLYEGNAVLHPRGAEYQTQFVVDGIPLTDNRSPGSGPEIEAEDLESVSIYTAGFPAEYGRKMGGVVELNTQRQTDPGLHGDLVLAGGSYDTLSGYGQVQETWKKDTFSVSASGAHTEHYLNPVVPENFTNKGTAADFAGTYERNLSANDRLMLSARRAVSRYEIPNELMQQEAGQVQDADNLETMGTARYQHVINANSVLFVSGMVRENAKDLESNVNPTPIAAFQHNWFREGYFKGTYSLHRGRHEFKTGVESDAAFLHENFRYAITDPSRFDPGTPLTMAFADQRPDLEQSAFAQDLIRMQDWTASVGLRWDHYQLLLNRNAVSPRLALSRAFPAQEIVIHAAYDRVFQTPAFENILISSSAQANAINSDFLHLPVKPSLGNDFEVGGTKGFVGKLRVDATTYWRHARNAADDDLLLNTGVSYPIAWSRSATYGAEGRVQLVGAGPVSGFASYSYMVAKVWFPVTGGLFLGKDAQEMAGGSSGHFPATQDQRNTLATRWEWSVAKRLQVAAGATYGSGLPFEYGGTEEEALAQYGPGVVSRLNFERGRTLPVVAVNASAIAGLYKHEHTQVDLHVDGENLNGRLNVLDFGGLFSGNAIAPGRSVLVRLDTRF